jgi:hypothetical protein
MESLARLQEAFYRAIVTGQSDAFAGRVRAGRMSGAERLATYAHGVDANWRQALADTYPVVERLVGAAFFGEAARQYARAHPSTSGDLHCFGSMFAEFLASYPHASALPYLPDVARLEWARHESSHAAEAGPFDLAALASVPERDHGSIRFRLHPAVRLLRSEYPVASIREANQEGRDGTLDRPFTSECVIVRRPDFEVRIERLSQSEWRFLAALEAGADLESATERLGEDGAAGLPALLLRLVEDRIVSGFTA